MDLDKLKVDIKAGFLDIEDTAILEEFMLGFRHNSFICLKCVENCARGCSATCVRLCSTISATHSLNLHLWLVRNVGLKRFI